MIFRSGSSATRDRFEVHTNFAGTVKRVYQFRLADLAAPSNLDVLRRHFTEPNSLRPDQTTARVTEQAAELLTQVADGMVMSSREHATRRQFGKHCLNCLREIPLTV